MQSFSGGITRPVTSHNVYYVKYTPNLRRFLNKAESRQYMLDLFGKVQITKDDVELWLDNLPNFSTQTTYNRREQYANFYDLTRIITDAMLNGSFELLKIQQLDILQRPYISKYQTVYVKTEAELQAIADLRCPKTRHYCTIKSCEWRIKQTRKKRNARFYAKKKCRDLA